METFVTIKIIVRTNGTPVKKKHIKSNHAYLNFYIRFMNNNTPADDVVLVKI